MFADIFLHSILSLKATTTTKNFYHPNQLSIRFTVRVLIFDQLYRMYLRRRIDI